MRFRIFVAAVAALIGLDLGVYLAFPSETTQAIEDIREHLAYVRTVLPDAGTEYTAALAVTTYVVGHVSAPKYGYLNELDGGSLPITADSILRTGAGICGEATTTAMTLYAALGIQSRRVLVWYDLPDGTIAGHTTTEVRWGDSWHWFDPTWGVFYEGDTVYSLVDVIQMTADARAAAYVGNDSMLWMHIVRASGVVDAPLAFLGFPNVRVESDGQILYERAGPRGKPEVAGS